MSKIDLDFISIYNNNNIFKEQFKFILNYELSNILKNNFKICGHKRSRNRGICMRPCKGIACNYHMNNTKIILPDDLVYVENYKKIRKEKKYPTIIIEDVSELDNSYKNNIYDFLDREKINTSNNIINKKILNKIIIKDNFLNNNVNNNTPKLICYYDKNNNNISSSALSFKTKKKKNKKSKKKKYNVMVDQKVEEKSYNELLDLNKKIKKYIYKNNNLNEIDKKLLKSFIDRITQKFNYNEKTKFYDLKKLSEDIYFNINKYLDLQIEKNGKDECLYIKSVFNLYNQIFNKEYEEDYYTDPIHFMS